ncbi:MAG: hypothetical protein WB473_13280, partial [Pedococcus sp.]
DEVLERLARERDRAVSALQGYAESLRRGPEESGGGRAEPAEALRRGPEDTQARRRRAGRSWG